MRISSRLLLLSMVPLALGISIDFFLNVDSRQAKRLAEEIAESVSGVKDVTNQIKVQHSRNESPRGDSTTTDTQTSGKAQQRKAS